MGLRMVFLLNAILSNSASFGSSSTTRIVYSESSMLAVCPHSSCLINILLIPLQPVQSKRCCLFRLVTGHRRSRPFFVSLSGRSPDRSEEHTPELQSHSFISYAF